MEREAVLSPEASPLAVIVHEGCYCHMLILYSEEPSVKAPSY
jgi:hypothetical protein